MILPNTFAERMDALLKQSRGEPAVRDALAYRLMRETLDSLGYRDGLKALDSASLTDSRRIERHG